MEGFCTLCLIGFKTSPAGRYYFELQICFCGLKIYSLPPSRPSTCVLSLSCVVTRRVSFHHHTGGTNGLSEAASSHLGISASRFLSPNTVSTGPTLTRHSRFSSLLPIPSIVSGIPFTFTFSLQFPLI